MTADLAPLARPLDNLMQAQAFVGALRPGDPVLLTTELGPHQRTYAMYVLDRPQLCDLAYGPPESIGVIVTLGPGRWSTRVAAENLVDTGHRGLIKRRYLLELDWHTLVLNLLAAETTVAGLTGLRVRYSMPDTDGGTNGRGALRSPVWAAEHEALCELRTAELEAGWSLPDGAVPAERPSFAARRAVPYREQSRSNRGRGRKVKVRGGVL